MADVTKDLIYEMLETLQHDLLGMESEMHEVKNELQEIRMDMTGLSQDMANICVIIGRQDEQLARIETHLELLEPAH